MPVELNITESVTELDTTVVTVTLESASEPGPAGPGVPVGGTAGQVLTKDSGTDYDTSWQDSAGGGGGAPTDVDYLVGTASGDLSAEIVVGATPGGELGGTWAAPTVDATHSGSSHASVQAAAEATAAGALSAHSADTTSVHGIADTSLLLDTGDIGSTVQAFDADLSTYAGITPSANVQSLLGAANYAAMRSQLDLEAGTDYPSLATFNDHSARHENGGADEISVAGLSGELADTQPTEASKVDSGAATDGQVLTADGAGGAAWETPDAGGSTDGWTADSDTWTYASASTFTVSGDVTARFSKGTRLKLTQTTVKYAVVVASSHAAGTTTVTIGVNSDYTLANAAITDTFYSYEVNPQGYPGWFNFVPTVTGYSSPPAVTYCRYNIMGPRCIFAFDNFNTSGNTSGTGFTVTMPVTPLTTNLVAPMQFANNSVTGTTPGAALLQASTVLALFRDWTGAAWTASGNKWARILIEFQF